ncbi:hypothetical protein NJH77_28110 [Serratia fonticola]|uniref:hypothetical protein n=1 Tax=Serratia fonticola TaxID=47917 RepID=UPI00209737A7|nr:hypothetical protein [Serratia fonticola]MCO7513092.1 hypothetical protein [Serratia fonticola]
MDYLFILILNKSYFNHIVGMKEVFAEWGGDIFSREPKEYIWCESILLKEGLLPLYMKNISPISFNDEDYISLYWGGDGIHCKDGLVKLEALISENLFKFEDWAVIFDIPDEAIDFYEASKESELSSIFDMYIKRSSAEEEDISGFMVYKS